MSRGRKDTSAEQQRSIAHMAKSAFAAHRLSWDPVASCWHCRPEGTGHQHYWFCLYIGPGVIMLWGDICETVLRVYEARPLGWLLSASSRDYMLGKIVAINEGKEEFFPGDVDVYLDDLISQYPTAPDEDGEVDEENVRYVAKLNKARELFDEYFDDGEHWTQAHAWCRAWQEAVGDGDVPDMDSWSSGALWFWHAMETFRRLHKQGREIGAALATFFRGGCE